MILTFCQQVFKVVPGKGAVSGAGYEKRALYVVILKMKKISENLSDSPGIFINDYINKIAVLGYTIRKILKLCDSFSRSGTLWAKKMASVSAIVANAISRRK